MNNFDPRFANNYDPRTTNGADGQSVQTAMPGDKMQINLTLTNNAAVELTVELWNFIDSMVKALKGSYVSGNYKYIPQDSYEGIQAIIASTDGTVGFNQNGDLVVRGLPADNELTVGCSEISYRGFYEASAITSFKVAYFRITVESSAQIDKVFTYFEKTIAGGIKENPISPRSYFKPTQYQNLTIDIPATFTIKIDSGLRYKLIAGETVTINLFINAWVNQSI